MGNVPLACERMNEFTLITSPFFFGSQMTCQCWETLDMEYIYLFGRQTGNFEEQVSEMNRNFLQNFYFIFDESFRNI